MNYNMLATEYYNAGGHCMVTICDIELIDEQLLITGYVYDGYVVLYNRDWLRSNEEPDDDLIVASWPYLDIAVCDDQQYKKLLEHCKKIHDEYTAAEFSCK